jgi:hypothetical protein
MQKKAVWVSWLVAGIACVGPVLAQEGHPLTGTWHGEWRPSPTQRTPVVMFMKWDGKSVTGMINPGPRAMPLKSVTLDPTQWMVRFEADGKDQAGNPVHVVIEGKLENIGSYNRTITGTWTQGSTKADFKITRD